MAWEEKQTTKTVITKEACRQELLAELRSGMPLHVIAYVLSALVAIFCLVVDTHNLLGNTLFLLMGIFFVGYDVFYIYSLIQTFRSLAKGELEIREDVLTSIEIETVRRRSRHGYTYHEEKVFYFDNHGRYVTGKKDGSAFEYSTAGDRFYLVIRTGKHAKPVPSRIYNAKVYEYRE